MSEASCGAGLLWVPAGAEGGDSSASECFTAFFAVTVYFLQVFQVMHVLI